MPFRLIRVFCAAPGNLEPEVQRFHDAVAECNASEGLAADCLFVPLTVSLKLNGQSVVDENIRSSAYYLQVLDTTWGPAGKGFGHDYRLAQDCKADPQLPMREVVVFVKDPPSGPVESDLQQFRQDAPEADSPRRRVFRDALEFQSQVRAALSGWLTESRTA